MGTPEEQAQRNHAMRARMEQIPDRHPDNRIPAARFVTSDDGEESDSSVQTVDNDSSISIEIQNYPPPPLPAQQPFGDHFARYMVTPQQSSTALSTAVDSGAAGSAQGTGLEVQGAAASLAPGNAAGASSLEERLRRAQETADLLASQPSGPPRPPQSGSEWAGRMWRNRRDRRNRRNLGL